MEEKDDRDPGVAYHFRMPASVAEEVDKIATELAEKNRIYVSRSSAIRMLVERGIEAYWEAGG